MRQIVAWHAGILSHLSATYDLSQLHLIGSSAGALVSILGACQVDPQAAVQLAHDLCVQHGVFRRPWGLAGVWGGLVRAWLQQLLPQDAADRCSGRVTVLVTQLPWLTTHGVNHFRVSSRKIEGYPVLCEAS
jgi:predicted acylesterase/phospholipase RssA